MSRELTPQEYVVFQQDTDYLGAEIPVYGSRVTFWQRAETYVLVYHTATRGYVLTDLVGLPQSVITELAKQSEVHGMWYYLSDSTQDVISQRAEQVIALGEAAGNAAAEITKTVAETVGETLHKLLAPLVDALFMPLVIVGVLLGIYIFKKG